MRTILIIDDQPLAEAQRITGVVEHAPARCAAVTVDEHGMLAAPIRRAGEHLTDPLDRLDAAVRLACTEKTYTDEIND